MKTQLNSNLSKSNARRAGSAFLIGVTLLVGMTAFAQKTAQKTAQKAVPPTLHILKFSNSPFVQIKVEVASTDAQRALGLMNRKKIDKDGGMLFISAAPENTCMWMKNTLLPLSVAFINAQGQIVNIEDMQPKTLTTHCAKEPVQYALEMNAGWFAAHQITPGTVVLNLPH